MMPVYERKGNLVDRIGKPVDSRTLRKWADMVQSPKSVTPRYSISENEDMIGENIPKYECSFSLVGQYGGMVSTIGYGESINEAIEDCDRFAAWLVNQYG